MTALLPVYLWESGGLQISHWLFVVFAALFLFRSKIGGRVRLPEVLLISLFLVVFGRESVAVAFGAGIGSLLPAAYVLFCLMVFYIFSRALVDDSVAWGVEVGIFLAVGIAIFGVLYIGYSVRVTPGVGRAVGTFNNPNQLGYFAICSFSISCLLHYCGRLSAKTFIAIVAGCIFLAIASLSKAAMLGIGFGATFAGFAFSRRKLVAASVGVVIAVVVIAGLLGYSYGALDEYAFVHRLENIGGQEDDTFEGRGYIGWFRDGALQMLFGLGSVEVEKRVGHEVHSTVASFFVKYGLLGGGVFVCLIVAWGVRVWRVFRIPGLVLIFMPPMLYGITHNGSRFTIFWLLLAMSFVLVPVSASGSIGSRGGLTRSR